jgi:HSP20 family protein
MNTQTELMQTKGNNTVGARSSSTADSVLRPSVDIFETGEGIVLQADMPGVSKERLSLRVEGNNLVVEGSIGIAPQEQMTALYADVRSTVYRRSFSLSNELEADRIEAHLQDGVLTVRIPKRAELRARRIEVRS